MTKDMHIDQLLQLLDAAEKKKWQWNRFEERIAGLRQYYQGYSDRGIPWWPYFTLHNDAHICRVLSNAHLILKALKKQSRPNTFLNALEMFVLIAAAYTHDIGMFLPLGPDDLELQSSNDVPRRSTQKYKEVFDDISSGRPLDSIKSDLYGGFVRDFHHWRSAIHIRNPQHAKQLQLEDWNGAIALVSEGHRKIDLYSTRYDTTAIGTAPIRLGLVAALLRIADELDVLRDRVPNALSVISANSIDLQTRKHWLRHFCTEGLSITKTETGSLLFEIICKELSVGQSNHINRKLMTLVGEGINSQLAYVNRLFLDHGIVFPASVIVRFQNTSVSVISKADVSQQLANELFPEIELEFHCPALRQHLEKDQPVTIEQRGARLICVYDENEHRRGPREYCTSSVDAKFDCGFCAYYGSAVLKPQAETIEFECPVHSRQSDGRIELVTLQLNKETRLFECQAFKASPKEWCQWCGFGKLLHQQQRIDQG